MGYKSTPPPPEPVPSFGGLEEVRYTWDKSGESRAIPAKAYAQSRVAEHGEPIETIEYKTKKGRYVRDKDGELVETKKLRRKLRNLRRSLPGWGDASS